MPDPRIENGILVHPRVHQHIVKRAEKGPMRVIRGVVVHQTNSWAAANDIGWFENEDNKHATGVHFIVDRAGGRYRGTDGRITQLARVTQRQAAHGGNGVLEADRGEPGPLLGQIVEARTVDEVKSRAEDDPP